MTQIQIAKELFNTSRRVHLENHMPHDTTSWEEANPITRHIWLEIAGSLLDRGVIARPRITK